MCVCARHLQYEAVPESLKNVLLVMNATGLLVPPSTPADDRGERQVALWAATHERIERFLPGFLDEIVPDEFTAGDGNSLGPAEIHEFLARRMYARRSKMNPLWNALLVGGIQNGKR